MTVTPRTTRGRALAQTNRIADSEDENGEWLFKWKLSSSTFLVSNLFVMLYREVLASDFHRWKVLLILPLFIHSFILLFIRSFMHAFSQSVIHSFRDGPLEKWWGGGWGKKPKKNLMQGKMSEKKIHARKMSEKKIHAQDGPHFDMKP